MGRMAKEMGVKYVKITTKHHEGFCLWPSQYSQYTVAQTPYRKDILGELVKATMMKVSMYISIFR